MLENYKEVVEALEETNESYISHRVNDILRVLTSISVIVLPLTLIASIWGMNVGVPGEGDTTDFYVIVGAMLVLLLGMVAYFRQPRLALSWLSADFAQPARLDLEQRASPAADPGRRRRRSTCRPCWARASACGPRYGEAWGWPPETMSIEADRDDLAHHEAEMLAREGFNYAILDADETELLGCVLRSTRRAPTPTDGVGADVSWWVRRPGGRHGARAGARTNAPGVACGRVEASAAGARTPRRPPPRSLRHHVHVLAALGACRAHPRTRCRRRARSRRASRRSRRRPGSRRRRARR